MQVIGSPVAHPSLIGDIVRGVGSILGSDIRATAALGDVDLDLFVDLAPIVNGTFSADNN